MKKFFTILLSVMMLGMVCAGCGTQKQEKTDPSASPSAEATAKTDSSDAPAEDLYADPIHFTIEMADGGVMKGELYPKLAPATVENFVKLCKEGFYDGLIFHRVIPGFMIQGGGYDQDMKEKPTDSIKGEFTSNGFTNELKHTRGVISMARTSDPNSASSQFFIMHADAPHLDGEYAAFGKITEGLDIIDEIAENETATNDIPVNPQVIKSITIQD